MVFFHTIYSLHVGTRWFFGVQGTVGLIVGKLGRFILVGRGHILLQGFALLSRSACVCPRLISVRAGRSLRIFTGICTLVIVIHLPTLVISTQPILFIRRSVILAARRLSVWFWTLSCSNFQMVRCVFWSVFITILTNFFTWGFHDIGFFILSNFWRFAFYVSLDSRLIDLLFDYLRLFLLWLYYIFADTVASIVCCYLNLSLVLLLHLLQLIKIFNVIV